MAKIKSVQSFNPEKPTIVVVNWVDGKKSVYDIADLPEPIVAQLAHHGLKQKTMDAHASLYRETGSIPSCREVSDAVYANLLANVWSEGGGGGTPWIVEALADLLDMDLDDAAEHWNAFDDAAQRKIRNEDAVKAWKAKRDLERLGDTSDAVKGLKDLIGK